jgi:acetyltransferase-like isoleucine patch superfamily enzyme
MNYYKHELADVQSSQIGSDTRIWQFVVILPGARIGARCNICAHVFIENDVEVGDDVTVKNGVQLWDGLRVGDGVFIGPNAILTNDRYPRSITATGELARADDWEVSPIRLRTGASIGAGAVVVAGRDVGRFATVGAGAVVTRSVPDHALVAGNPARRIGWVCACGRRLVGGGATPEAGASPDAADTPLGGDATGPATCPACHAGYHIDGDRCVPAAAVTTASTTEAPA